MQFDILNFVCRQTALLAAISEKDSNIALLELQSSSKSRKQEIKQCKSEKDKLVNELKLQVNMMIWLFRVVSMFHPNNRSFWIHYVVFSK